MVVYQVFSRPQLVRHYATVCSEATLFQLFTWCLIIIPPFFIAYSSNDFWQYESSYREQPNVRYTRQMMVYLSDNNPGGDRAWGTFPNFVQLLDPTTIIRPLVRSREIDHNRDGRVDVFNFTLEFTLDQNQVVSGIRLLTFFDVQLHTFSYVCMQSLAYVSTSWSTPCTSVWIGSELHLRQTEPIPRFGGFYTYNTSLINSDSPHAVDYDFRTILSNYYQRNVSTMLTNIHDVWSSGQGNTFTLQLEITVPEQIVIYRPGFWQLIKFAWIQYVAIFLLFYVILSHVKEFVFDNQIIRSIRHNPLKQRKL
ncbi:transmembrane protein 231-like [Dysidea avara]|uniref:transmembrane protein 231-like n=1 Tax=Dysidea avara TaxID=196820 RepID=UPI0033223FEF